MSTINDGGPAFPSANDVRCGDFVTGGHAGMTLRDYFAAKALGGMLADIPKSCYGLDWKNSVATEAYGLADAMLRAREVKS